MQNQNTEPILHDPSHNMAHESHVRAWPSADVIGFLGCSAVVAGDLAIVGGNPLYWESATATGVLVGAGLIGLRLGMDVAREALGRRS